ncbi:MAG: OmpA family protein [Pseudomonadales bacterium]|nr:OmpA family protein [Pseudomonadales bacterium]
MMTLPTALTTASTSRYKMLLAACMTLPLMTACVSTSKFEALQDENVALQKENAHLMEDGISMFEALILQDDEIEALNLEQKEMTAAFSSFIDEGVITLKMMSDGLHLTLPQDVLFSSGQTQLSVEGEKLIAEVAKELVDHEYQIVVTGNTDNVPVGAVLAKQYPSNWEVAGARAGSVVRLLEEHGVPADKLAAVSFGENRAVADNDSEDGRAQNRRIEIRLRPILNEV